MSSQADTQPGPQDPGGVPSAGPQEPYIPKHRFDDVLENNRELRGQVQAMTQLLQQQSANARQVQNPDVLPAEFSPQALGMEEGTFRQFVKLAEHIADRKVNAAAQQVQGQLGAVMNTAEEGRFLAKFTRQHGDVSGYLPKIRERRQAHWQQTRQVMDIEDCFKIIRYEEAENRAIRRPQTPAQAPQPGQAPPAPAAHAPQANLPSDGTAGFDGGGGFPAGDLVGSVPRSAPTAPSAGPAQPKAFDELTVDEMEAQLDRGLAAGNLRF